MKIPYARALLLPLWSVMFLVGCATQQKTSAVECAAGGAAAGLVMCKILGKSDRDCAAFMAGIGALGGAICYNYASQLDKRRQQLAGRENDLDARLQYVRGLNEDGTRLNAELRERVTAASQRTAELSAQIRRNQASAGAIAKERQRLENEVASATQQVQLQRDAVTEIKAYRANRATPSVDLDAEIAKQASLLEDAQQQVDTLVTLKESV